MGVFCGLPGPHKKDDSARIIWILFSHTCMGMSVHTHYIHRNKGCVCKVKFTKLINSIASALVQD